VNDIKVSGIKLLEMINEILDITKLESHTIKLNLSYTDISLMIEEVCNTLKPLFEKKGV
jgi:signal transduction histidine kinase